ncbi:MAG TPA: NAD-dependent epimerase/dehydratase family protein [Kofleriaceae bacterium]|jgi:2'-hydroxyisoflavone reductase|nr:NAD-dependent epimerase/dehydratase family protein [Kofleriaceae bacterium]
MLRGGLAAAALGLVSSACSNSTPAATTTTATTAATPPPKLKILILGGTGFLGPKTIDAAIARGHNVTIFNRGKREKQLPLEHQVEHLYGNRDPELPADDERGPDGKLLRPDASPKGLEQLVGREFDVVIDNSGYVPRLVKASAQLLAKSARQYIFISTVSVYDDAPAAGGDESTRLATIADPTTEKMGDQFENYGALKVLCERAVQEAFPNGATIVRPGFIVGPGDPTDRFTYWPIRISRGGDVLAPGTPDDPLQWIDVRDLAEWLVLLAERGTTGTFNALGPSTPARWGDVLQACVTAAPGAKLEWVPAEWLEKQDSSGEDAFPIWIPPVGKFAGFHRWNNDRAEAAGLTFRPVSDTIKAILEWYPREIERRVRVTNELVEAAKAKGAPPPKLGDPQKLRVTPTPERERELLAAWRARTPTK